MDNEIEEKKIDNEEIEASIKENKDNIKYKSEIIDQISDVMRIIDDLYSIGGASKNRQINRRKEAMRLNNLERYSVVRNHIYDDIGEDEIQIRKLKAKE